MKPLRESEHRQAGELTSSTMRFAYADPPYLGCGNLYDHPEWNLLETHAALIRRLELEYPDGWVLSGSSPSLKSLLDLCTSAIRVMAWVKPFASFKPNVNPAYAWEPLIVSGGRRRTREQETVRDWVSCPITVQKGLIGAKPRAVCHWILQVLNFQPGDALDDLYPGTGVMGRCVLELEQGFNFQERSLSVEQEKFLCPICRLSGCRHVDQSGIVKDEYAQEFQASLRRV